MLDKEGRIMIPEEFRESYQAKGNVYIYYDEEDNRFFILPEEVHHLYMVAIRKLDSKGRFFLPKVIKKMYKTKSMLIVSQEKILLLLPLKEE